MNLDQEKQWLLYDKYGGKITDEFYRDVERLESDEPLAYIIGWQPFCGVKIYLDSRPLIPRPETEYLVSVIIAETAKSKPLKILDLCAGSGCIGIALLKALPESIVHFAEIDELHHTTILKNIQGNNIDKNRVKIFEGDLFENITETYDIIITNPPYIDPELISRVDESTLKFEPEQALFGGRNGMEIITKIAQNAPNFMNSEGVLWIEHEPEQVSEIQRLLPGSEVVKDQFRVNRFTKWKK